MFVHNLDIPTHSLPSPCFSVNSSLVLPIGNGCADSYLVSRLGVYIGFGAIGVAMAKANKANVHRGVMICTILYILMIYW